MAKANRKVKAYYVYAVLNGKKTKSFATNKLKVARNKFTTMSYAARPTWLIVLLHTKNGEREMTEGRRKVPAFQSLMLDKMPSLYLY